jgi:hypothetical protein
VKVAEGEAWSGTVNPAGLAVSGEDTAAMTVAEAELAGCMPVDSVDSQRTAVVTEVVVARKRKIAFVAKQNALAAVELEEQRVVWKTETRMPPGLHMGRLACLPTLDLCMLVVQVVVEVAGDSNMP